MIKINNMAAKSPKGEISNKSFSVCAVCEETELLKRCGYCKSVLYCSREHQLKDWKSHKPVCQKIKAELEKQRANDANNSVSSGYPDEGSSTEFANSNNFKTIRTNNDTQTTDPIREEIGYSFDNRPFKKSKFLRVKNNLNEFDTAKIATDGLCKNGFCVLDGLLLDSEINKAINDIHCLEASNKMMSGKLAGGRASDTQGEMVVNADIRSDKIAWLEGSEEDVPGIKAVMNKMDNIFIHFNSFLVGKNISGRSKAMIACYPGNGTYYHQHVDNPSRDGRLVTCILYLNKDWDVEKDGGLLRIFPEGSKSYVDVAPEANRLLFFWSDKRNPHEVQPAFRKRYAITAVWYMDKAEREQARLDKTSAELSHMKTEYALLEVAQRQKELDEVNTKLEENAASAVAALSDEELKALATMIKDVPDPSTVLSGLGISSSIQEKLVSKLKSLTI